MNGQETKRLVDFYNAHRLYRRERRTFRKKGFGGAAVKVPDASLIKPDFRVRVFGGRMGPIDKVQGIFGYFFGGGWVFGFVENEIFRAEASSFLAYEASHSLRPVFRAGNVKGKKWKTIVWKPGVQLPRKIPKRKYVEVIVDRKQFPAAGKMPTRDQLRPVDLLALEHDRELRKLNMRAWANKTYAKSDAYLAEREAVNRVLREGLISYRDKGWRESKADWQAAKPLLSDKDWEGMGSLILYERCLMEIAILALSTQDGVPGWGTQMKTIARAFQTSEAFDYAPPSVRLPANAVRHAVSAIGQDVLVRAGQKECAMNNMIYDQYQSLQAAMEDEYLQEMESE